MAITAETKVCCIIGDPVSHSLSPTMHNAAFQELGLDYVYLAFQVTSSQLREVMDGVRGLGIRGMNVTVPHKERCVRFLDKVDATAKEVGAVNTILNDSGKLFGYNTDGMGAYSALREAGVDPADKKIVMIGAGGASRSIAYTLAPRARMMVILNRTAARASRLAKEISARSKSVRGLTLDSLASKASLEEADLVINATSVGMRPAIDETPVDASLINPDATVFDIVYNPVETKFLREARSKGARTIDGVGMLVHQGAEAFRMWTGREPPLATMRKAVLSRLGGPTD